MNLSILVVDDDADVRASLCSMLSAQYPTWTIHEADCGRSGLACFKRHDPDIVMTDMRMPVMDGISMATEIRALNPSVPIIVLTAFATVEFLLRSIEIGVNYYLLKPLVCEKLFGVIDEIAQRKEMQSRLDELVREQKAAKDLLQLSEERFRQLFDQSNDAIFIVNTGDLSVVDCNGEAEVVLGYRREDLVGRRVLSLLVEPARLFGATPGAVDNNCRQVEKTTLRKKDGTGLLVSARVKTIRLNASEVFYCSFRDITDLVRIEQEALDAQANLIQADKMASLGLLVSGMAHEINNPNNCILFNAELLAKTWKSTLPILEGFYGENGDFKLGSFKFSETRDIIPKLFSGLVDGAERIRGIVDMLKDFARQDKGDTLGSLDVNQVLANAIAIVNHEIKRRCSRFYLEAGHDLPPALGNAQQIEQVMINLIMNALQSLGSFQKSVRLRSSLGQDGEQILITVTDEGEGMSAEVLERLMDPFFTTKGDSGGTGLGLSISASILQKNQGAISFVSAPGEGTTAEVQLRVFQG